MSDYYEVFRWSEVRDRYMKLTKGDQKAKWRSQPTMENLVSGSWAEEASWAGGSIEQVHEWLRDGYKPPEMLNIDKYTPMSDRRRNRPAEEGGEVDFTRAWSGDPQPFNEWEMRKSKPGLRIIAEMAMHCGTSASVIADYGAWLAGILHGLETQGFDVELDVQISVDGLMTDGDGGRSAALIRVTDEGEYSDFEEWSALFSPAGFRTLGFVSLGLVADRVGKTASEWLGRPTGSRWETHWDQNQQTLTISCPNGDSSFPSEKMTQQLRDHGLFDD